MKSSFALPLLLCSAIGYGAIALAQSPGTFSGSGNMTTPRSWHTATLLTNGKVLIAGGAYLTFGENALATAELYDPATGTFAPTGNMTTPRSWHTAILLPDGRVLIAGGGDNLHPSNGAELYDPSTGRFAATSNTIHGRACPQAHLLGNGKVLLSGGSILADDHVPDAELYDPTTGTFAGAGQYATDPHGFNFCRGAASTLLPNGKVLIVWEEDAAEIYDPENGSFTETSKPPVVSYANGLPTATLLMDGKVLLAGGAGDGGAGAAALYDSQTGTFTATASMITARISHTATLLPDGTVLLAGNFLFPDTNAELYNPVTGAFTAPGPMISPRGGGQTATLLNDGRVLITGGYSPFPAITSNTELYRPAVSIPAPQLFSVSGNGQGQGAILHAGSARVATPSDPAIAGESLEIYGTGLNDGSVIPPQVAIGGRLAEILYFGNAPGFTDLSQVNVRVPSGIMPAPAVPVRLTYLGRPSNAVTIGVQ